MRIVSSKLIKTAEIIKITLNILRKGGLAIVPSDTVYGLAVDAANFQAVNKLQEFKNRPPGKAISVFVNSIEKAEEIVYINKKQEKIVKKLSPGPFTFILSSKQVLNKDLESEKKNLGIRLPKFNFINQLTKTFKKPITATSANLSGKPPHYSIQTLLKTLPEKKKKFLDLIVDFGKLPRNKPSTVVDLTSENIKIVRQGDLMVETLRRNASTLSEYNVSTLSGRNVSIKNNFISKTPFETQKIAKFLLNKNLEQINQKPLIFLIEGELGVGKTIFVKGIGEELNIKNIVSPTFVIYYEYKTTTVGVNNFYHFDFYRIKEKEEFNYLAINDILKPKTIICVEWGEKSGEIFNLLKQKAKIVYVKMKYIDEKKREIII